MKLQERKLQKRHAVLVVALLLALVTLPAFAEEIVAQGSEWDKRNATIEGDWKIVERDGGLVLVLGEGFKTKKAPDLKAFLVSLPPTAVGKSEIPANAARIGLLKSAKGAQELEIPDLTSLDGYRALVIHCEQYSKVWAVTSLR